MTIENLPHFTHSGLPGIDRIQYGTHACHFYKDREQLAEALLPYTIAGLDAKERCLWITAAPLRAREAVQALRTAWAGTDDAEQTGALRILDFDVWYMNSSVLKGPEMIHVWLAEEERALAEGYRGLRISANTSFLEAGDWPRFMKFERALSTCLNGRRIVALCSYGLEQCTNEQMSQVARRHHCAVEHSGANWQLIATPPLRNRTGTEATQNALNARQPVRNDSVAVACDVRETWLGDAQRR